MSQEAAASSVLTNIRGDLVAITTTALSAENSPFYSGGLKDIKPMPFVNAVVYVGFALLGIQMFRYLNRP